MSIATQEQADAILAAIKVSDAEREASMPTTFAALHQISTAKERLGKMGWRDAMYCPKNGSEFAVVQWGSTGVHLAHYMGEWPTGHLYCGDFLSSHEGMMWKPIDKLTSDELEAMKRSNEDVANFIERLAHSAS